RLLAATIVIGLLAAACGDAAPSAPPSAAVPASAPATGTSQPTAAPPASSASPSAAPSASEGAASAAPSGSTAPSASEDPESKSAYDLIERQVAGIRGLVPTKSVPRRFINADQLRTILT